MCRFCALIGSAIRCVCPQIGNCLIFCSFYKVKFWRLTDFFQSPNFIEKRYNELEPVESWLNELHAYVKKYAHSGIQELYAAYLDIAHINDGFWAVLTYPDGTYSKPFESGDPTLDKERAAKYKAEALKYYAKVIISGYAGRYYPARRIAIERFEALKQNKKSGYSWIIYD